jgi:hypothetical protein
MTFLDRMKARGSEGRYYHLEDEDREAAIARIEQLEEMMRGANALIELWRTRATRAEEKLASKREENSDVGLGFRGNNDYA